MAQTPDETSAALRLRAAAFRGNPGADDSDGFDAFANHMLIEHDGKLRATYRYHLHPDAGSAACGYTGQFYGLDRLASLDGPLIELGRFCVSPEAQDPRILRLAWAALTRIVDEAGATLLFGCSSFVGADPLPHRAGLAYLAAHHIGPDTLRPPPIGEAVVLTPSPGQDASGVTALPPLLRSYLGMGGWVSDAAVSDHDLDTLHVFTGVEIARIPPARARALRQLAN